MRIEGRHCYWKIDAAVFCGKTPAVSECGQERVWTAVELAAAATSVTPEHNLNRNSCRHVTQVQSAACKQCDICSRSRCARALGALSAAERYQSRLDPGCDRARARVGDFRAEQDDALQHCSTAAGSTPRGNK